MTAGEPLLLAAAVASLAAMPLLLAGRFPGKRSTAVGRWCAWLALAVSIALFALLTSWSRAIPLALTGLAVPALLLVWRKRDRKAMPMRERPAQAAPARDRAAALRRCLHAAARILVAVPLAFAAASLAAAPVALLTGNLSGGVVLALAVAVLLWALAALWAFADPLLWRPASALMVLALVSGLSLWLS